ncbi:hypothetical protein AGMMS50293_28470 [Spirochaetia bacterium]|nr:hypothetical protein AGMMS50293_28470 [Spirochaetia bacterium]
MSVGATKKLIGEVVVAAGLGNSPKMVVQEVDSETKLVVEWFRPGQFYDKVYSSKVFDFTPNNMLLPKGKIYGGTRYNLNKLPDEIDQMYPDYSISNVDYAIGFITRGCPNKCRWCYVPEKEGDIAPYREWQSLIREDSNKLILMDNNILASDWGIKQLESLSETNIHIDLNQGMDAIRLVDSAIIKLIGKLKWILFARFSCDTMAQVDKLCKLYKKLKALHIYAQAERGKNIVPTKEQKRFQMYIYSMSYLKFSFEDFKRINGYK